MLPFENLLSVDKQSNVPLFKQLANKLIALIQEGKIPPGTIIPGTRKISLALDVNRKTITRAYEELIAQDWLEALPQKGYRVIPELPVIKPRSFHPKNNFKAAKQPLPEQVPGLPTFFNIDRNTLKKTDIIINDGYPDASLLPYNELLKNFKKQFNQQNLRQQLSLRDIGGLQMLKVATCNFLNETRGLYISDSEIVLTRGAQMAIFIAASILVNPGDEVAVTDPNYPFADKIFKHTGARLVKVRVDEDGMDVDHLEQLLKAKTIKVLYIVPHHHHPTTVTLGAARRFKLLQLINAYGLWVIEDDYDYDFHFKNSPILPLASSDHGGRIIYIGSFTKLLAPPYRVGYMIAAPDLIQQAIALRSLMDLRGDTILEQALADMIINGDLARHIKKSNKLYSQRCTLICRLLTENLGNKITFTQPYGGMAVWIKFNRSVQLELFIKKAAAEGLFFVGSVYINEKSLHHNGLRFGYASLTDNEIETAIKIMARLLK